MVEINNIDNCKFSYYCRDQKTADVEIINGVVKTTPYTDVIIDLPFGKVPDRLVSKKTVKLFFEENCVPKHRANIKDFLEHYGLEEHDAYKICRITNGVMADSPYRIEWTDTETDE